MEVPCPRPDPYPYTNPNTNNNTHQHRTPNHYNPTQMAKPPGPIGRTKREHKRQQILQRGAAKLKAKHQRAKQPPRHWR